MAPSDGAPTRCSITRVTHDGTRRAARPRRRVALRHADTESAGAVLVLRIGGVFLVGTPQGDPETRRRDPRAAWAVACAFAIAYTAGHVMLAAGPLNVVPRAWRGQPRLPARRLCDPSRCPAPTSSTGPAGCTARLDRTDAVMAIRLWAPHPDIAAQAGPCDRDQSMRRPIRRGPLVPRSISLGMALPDGLKTLRPPSMSREPGNRLTPASPTTASSAWE